MARYWWLLALRGVAAIIFGILAFAVPGVTLLVLVLLFGIYALIDGVLAIVSAFQQRQENDRWWVVLLEGLAGVAAGVVTLLFPDAATLFLLILIAVWAIFTGIMETIAAIRLRREIENEWALGVTGVLSVILGVLLLINPGAGALGLIWVIGAYAVIAGVLMLYLAFKLRGSAQKFAV
jgi:uncharacterized membrane protein HdeD (DUF308 family)